MNQFVLTSWLVVLGTGRRTEKKEILNTFLRARWFLHYHLYSCLPLWVSRYQS